MLDYIPPLCGGERGGPKNFICLVSYHELIIGAQDTDKSGLGTTAIADRSPHLKSAACADKHKGGAEGSIDRTVI